jgi:glutamine synthetase
MTVPERRLQTPPTGIADVVTRHGLWTPEQVDAAAAVEAQLDSLDAVRVVFGDPHGVARSKTLTANGFRSVLRNGMDFSPGPFVFDSGHAVAVDFFAAGGGIGLDELTGAGDFLVVPDPLTFRVLPHPGRRTGWVVGDEHLRSGQPHPLSSRAALRRQCDRLAGRDLTYVVGLEVEWYLTRYTDGGRPGQIGGFGVQGSPPAVEPVDGGYQFNSDALLDALLPLLDPVVEAVLAVGLPLRTIEHESGPGQLEFTFEPMEGVAAADAMLLFRTVAKQVLARAGYHASFMSLPGLAGFDPSGWHLHQSLAEHATGRNVLAAESTEAVLSDLGSGYLGGLLEHARSATLLAVPSVNGYRRMQSGFTLSPDRIGWCRENRGAFLRVIGGGGEPDTHVENRAGEPSANPYLYLAANLAAGLDGIDRKLDPGPPADDPHDRAAEALPRTLTEALDAFAGSTFARDTLGAMLHDCLCRLKGSELARYEQWAALTGAAEDGRVTEWEQREYFGTV